MAKLDLDEWQAWIIENACATRAEQVWNPYTGRYENKWAATEVGIMVSRQNGKGSICEARQLAGLFLFGERLLIHSAHQFDTSLEAFNRVLMLIEDCPDLDREVKRVAKSHGEEGIELKSGQRLRFRTRTKGGGRGFTADCLFLDEDMFLDSVQVGALMPTMSARPNPQLWCLGSAGDKKSTHKGRLRQRAQLGGDPRLLYAEWSAEYCNPFCTADCDEHDRPDSIETHAKTNPALGIRITVEHIETERRSMDPEMFGQERHGIGDWPVEGDSWAVIDKESWESRTDERSCLTGRFALAVDTSPDRAFSAIGVYGLNTDGMHHAEITFTETDYDHRPGTQWVVPRVLDLWNTQNPVCVVIDPASQAGSFILQLQKAGVNVVTPNSREYAQACGDLVSGIIPRKGEVASLVHLGQAPLTTAVAAAAMRTLADLWAWSKTNSASDISPLVAITLAGWGFKKYVYQAETVAPWVYRR